MGHARAWTCLAGCGTALVALAVGAGSSAALAAEAAPASAGQVAVEALPDGGYLLQDRALQPGWEWVSNRWILIRGGRVEEFTIGHRLYGAADLCALLRAVGFIEVQAFGGLDGSPYDQRAQRLVVVGRRAP